MILYQMCVAGEVKAIKVNNPATIHGWNARDCEGIAPHMVETIAKVQDVFAKRYDLGLSVDDARSAASDLFDIASERNDAISRTGKYANDAVFAPKALRWLDEEEEKILKNLQENTNEAGQNTWYNGEGSEPEEDKETAADIHRRAKYADIDEKEASKQIEQLIMKNVEEAKRVAALYDLDKSGPFPKSGLYAWFYQNVKKDSPMDYKNQKIWQNALPGLPYPEEDKAYNVFGINISSSDLGNLNYAMIGKALGIPEFTLLQQAGAAELRDHGKRSFLGSQFESFKERDRGFGDQGDDQKKIAEGFDIYDYLTEGK